MQEESHYSKENYFTGQKILILKHLYLAECNSDTYCPVAVSFAGRYTYVVFTTT